jgi:outer membrane protein assembly factor BamB
VFIRSNGLSGSEDDDWPQWRGPNRDGKSVAVNLMSEWPSQGPPLVLHVQGIGEGNSSPVVSGDRILVSGDQAGRLTIFCFDWDGGLMWQAENGCANPRNDFPGALGTPTIHRNLVFSLSATGRLAAFRLDDGHEIWSFDLTAKFGGKAGMYGYAESVLAWRENLLVSPGGDTTIACVRQDNGETVWRYNEEDTPDAAYASAILDPCAENSHVVYLLRNAMIGIDPATARRLWRYQGPFDVGRNCLTPVLFEEGSYVFADGGEYDGRAVAFLDRTDGKWRASEVWTSKRIGQFRMGGYIERLGYIYGFDGRTWACINAKTGQTLYREPSIKHCSTLWIDGHYLVLTEEGELCLIRADASMCAVISRVLMGISSFSDLL